MGTKLTDSQILHRAKGIERIRECLRRAKGELTPIVERFDVNGVLWKGIVKVGGFAVEVDHDLKDDEFYFKFP